jgi:hypothetical protein
VEAEAEGGPALRRVGAAGRLAPAPALTAWRWREGAGAAAEAAEAAEGLLLGGEGSEMVAGRGSHCTLCVGEGEAALAAGISRTHATLRVAAGGACYIRDERSTKGTYVDGARLAPGREQRLQPGAKIQFGDSRHYYVYGV